MYARCCNRFARHIRLAVVLALTMTPGVASAQAAGGPIDLQLFRPAIDSKGYITLNASQVLGHLDPSFGLVLNWSLNPFSISGQSVGGTWCSQGSDPNNRICDASNPNSNPVLLSRYRVENLVTGHFQAALGLFRNFEVGIGFPVSLWNGDTDPNPDAASRGSTGAVDAQGIGDLGLHLKGRILNTSRHAIGLAGIVSFYFPTGDSEKFLGSDAFQVAPSIIVDKELFARRLSLAVNLGARFRTKEGVWVDDRSCELQGAAGMAVCGTGREIRTQHTLHYGFGAALALVPQRLSLVAEIIGQTGFDGFANADRLHSAAEVLAGLKLYLARNSYFGIGVGRGLRGGGDNYQYGSPDLRVFGAFIFEPSVGDRDGDGIKDDVDLCPDDPEDFDDFEDEDGCPDPDNDRDGIPDVDDKCPNEPEDFDGFEDDDGCPEANELDRDGDGIPDHLDKCPDDPEDFDGFEDEDGCPDPDNDGDGILDVDDLCPNEPEDFDGFEDEDGCPDPDNDGDRILDKDDKCPNEPETYNGFEDEDGCPDKGRVVVHKGRIEILDKIYFETAKAAIKPVSFPILDAIAATLKGTPQIQLAEIQGHADERGGHEYNLKLTDDRAHSVRKYLIDKGVEGARLQAKGYGKTRPIDPRSNEQAWSKNRRVEFVILKRAD